MTICTRCKVDKNSEHFLSVRGKTTRMCQGCREYIKKHRNKCKHDCRSDQCKLCQGGSICEHNRQKYFCKKCNGTKAVILLMIGSSRKSDRRYGRYDANNFIDKCFIEGLFEENPNLICPYCEDKMSLEYDDINKVSIERIDNTIGHIKSNCILACLQCNVKRIGQRN